MKNIFAYVFLSALFLVSCEDPNNSDPEAGICVHTYEDPILAIESVSSESGDPISEIYLSNLSINGSEQDLSSVTDDPSNNVSVEDSSIVCTIPCGFGTQEGTYQFDTSTPDYQDTTITFEGVSYEVFNGGCPSSNSGSREVSFELKSQ